MQAVQNPLKTEKVSKLLRTFAIPSIIAMLVSALYNIVDQVFIGWSIGALGNAATNVAFPLTTIWHRHRADVRHRRRLCL